MYKQIFFLILLISLFNFSSADFLGTYELDKEMQITNYCSSGTCDYVELISLEYPNGTIQYFSNLNMTKNGQIYNYSFIPELIGEYCYSTCGYDSLSSACDYDCFQVNLNGEDNSIGVMIILLVFFMLLFYGYYSLNKNVNYEKWYNKILAKYENKNYVKLTLSSIGFNLIRNKIGNYYFLVFPIILVLYEIIVSYNINSLVVVFENILFIYTLGIIMIAVLFIGQAQEFIVNLIKDATNNSWGIGND